ncbi:MAG TPA: glycosyltransferase family 25 protein [Woeseiaceae bacterium]|nr:glycosyltransferase family 25 protein [Woeseiaceae bacterium]
MVISLADALERRRQAAWQLGEQGLDFRWLDALRGAAAQQQGSFEVIDEIRWILHTGRRPTPGEIGCFASHRLAWQQCVAAGQPILVMEDDFRLLPGFRPALEWLEELVGEYGFVRLQTETRARKRLVRRRGDLSLWRYTKVPHSMMCYGISPAAAQAFLRQTVQICEPVDVFVKRYWAHGQAVYGIMPYSVEESGLSRSTSIAGRAKSRKSPAVALARFGTRLNWLCRRLICAAGYELRPLAERVRRLAGRGISALPNAVALQSTASRNDADRRP